MNRNGIVALTAALSGAAGAAAGYVVAMKRLEAKYAEIADKEIAQARAFYKILDKDGYPSPAEFIQAKRAAEENSFAQDQAVITRDQEQALSAEYRGEKMAPDVEEGMVEVVENIFVNGQAIDRNEFDYEVEVPLRGMAPYIIHEEEFLSGEKDYPTAALAYFAGDDVLCDDKDDVITDVDGTIGVDNLMRFGHGAGSPDALFVRNDTLEIDFEIVRDHNKFTVVVLGLGEEDPRELQHSDHRRRFRDDDER